MWSDAARQAALEARRRKATTKAAARSPAGANFKTHTIIGHGSAQTLVARADYAKQLRAARKRADIKALTTAGGTRRVWTHVKATSSMLRDLRGGARYVSHDRKGRAVKMSVPGR